MVMDSISPTIQKEIDERLAAGPYRSVDELLRDALRALDRVQDVAQDLLERELIEGLEGEDVAMTPEDWDDIESEALKGLEAKKSR
jgi:Arc/MetJ-type ribon-helix-helix transcriptional regulator